MTSKATDPIIENWLPFELRVVPLRDNEVALEVWQESVNRWPERAKPKRSELST